MKPMPIHTDATQRLLKALIPCWILVFTFSLVTLPTDWAFAQKLATLENVKGNVRVFKAGKTRGRKGRDGMALFATHIVKTIGSDSGTDVRFARGGVIRVMPDSEFVLTRVEVEENKFNIGVQLAAGKIFNVVDRLTEGSSYTVNTRSGTSGVKGTIYSAQIFGGQTVFMVKEGTVVAASPTAPGKQVAVNSLNKTVINAGQSPSDPIPLTPEEIAMFDVLTDVRTTIKGDIRQDIRETIQEEMIAPDLDNFRPNIND